MNKVWIICLMLLCFGSVTLLGTAQAGDSKSKTEKVEKKPAKTIQAPAAKKVERAPKKPDRFIDKNNNGVNDRQKPKVVKPKVVKPRPVTRTKAATQTATQAKPKPKKEKAPPG